MVNLSKLDINQISPANISMKSVCVVSCCLFEVDLIEIREKSTTLLSIENQN